MSDLKGINATENGRETTKVWKSFVGKGKGDGDFEWVGDPTLQQYKKTNYNVNIIGLNILK